MLGAVALRFHEGLSALGLDELYSQIGRHHGPRLLGGLSHAVRQRRDAALLKVLVHEGVDDGVVEAVEEADGLDDGDDHVERHSVVFLFQVVLENDR